MTEPPNTPITRLAHAKLNLCLEIIGKRDDNYHDITSVIQAVDLHDTLTFAPAGDNTLTLECDDPTLAAEGDSNLVLKAAHLLQKTAGINSGAHITLHKEIPMSAGIGGGSSDAAGALLGLTELWNLRISKSDLAEMAAALGSDVPFFLEGPTALVEGRGERVTRIPSPPPGWAVLVCPRYDLKNKTMQSQTQNNRRVRQVDLKKIDFSPKTGKVMKLDLGADQKNIFSGDATASFKEAKLFKFEGINQEANLFD